VSVDKVNHQVTVRAGTTLTELIELLREHGLAMTNLGSIPFQTVAGAILTGTQTACVNENISIYQATFCKCRQGLDLKTSFVDVLSMEDVLISKDHCYGS